MCVMARTILELGNVRCLRRTSAVNNSARSQLAPTSADDSTASMFHARINCFNLNHAVDIPSYKRTIIQKLFNF
jgi:hypothetical protein